MKNEGKESVDPEPALQEVFFLGSKAGSLPPGARPGHPNPNPNPNPNTLTLIP